MDPRGKVRTHSFKGFSGSSAFLRIVRKRARWEEPSYPTGRGVSLRATVLNFRVRDSQLALPVPQLAGENLQNDERVQQVVFQVMSR